MGLDGHRLTLRKCFAIFALAAVKVGILYGNSPDIGSFIAWIAVVGICVLLAVRVQRQLWKDEFIGKFDRTEDTPEENPDAGPIDPTPIDEAIRRG